MQTSNNSVFREVISPLVAVSFLAVATTGIMMMLHVRFGSIKAVHEWMGVAMAVAALLHLFINWRVFMALYRHLLAVVATLAGLLLLGALLLLVPADKRGGPGDRHDGPPPWIPRAGQQAR